MFPLIRFSHNSVGFKPYDQDIPNNRIKIHSKFQAFFLNLFSNLFKIGSGTVKIQDLEKNKIHLNKPQLINWITTHQKDAKLDKKSSQALRDMLRLICAQKPPPKALSKPPKTPTPPLPPPPPTPPPPPPTPLPPPPPTPPPPTPPPAKLPEEINFEQTFDAAQQNDALAQAKLSKLYWHGIGTKESSAKAIEYARKSAAQGNCKGQYLLSGFLLNDPNASPAQIAEGVSLLQQSAEQGFSKAEFILGNVYLRGRNPIKQSPAEAFRWIKRAADHKYKRAYELLGLLYLKGIGTTIEEAKAFHWHFKAAHLKNPSPAALRTLGILYQDGIGIKQSSDRAFKWLHKAAIKNDRSAQYLTAIMFLKGVGTPVSAKNAFDSFVKAMNQGDRLSKAWVGLMFFDKGDHQIGLNYLLSAWIHGDQTVRNFINIERAARHIAPELFIQR